MSGWLRELSDRRIADRDRRRVFLVVVAVMVIAAVLGLAAYPGARRPTRPQRSPLAAERSTVLSRPATRPPSVASASPAPAMRATRVFLGAYLRLTYGRGSRDRVTDATAALKQQLADRWLVIPPALRRLRPHLVSLTGLRRASGWRVRAVIADGGGSDYPIVLTLVHGHRGWLVSGVRG